MIPDSNAVVQRMDLPLLVLVLLTLRNLEEAEPGFGPGPDSMEEEPDAKRLGEGGSGKSTKFKSTEDSARSSRLYDVGVTTLSSSVTILMVLLDDDD